MSIKRNFEPVQMSGVAESTAAVENLMGIATPDEAGAGYQSLYKARTEMDRGLDLLQQARVVGDQTLELHAARVAVKRCNQLTGVLERLASALKKEDELTPVEW